LLYFDYLGSNGFGKCTLIPTVGGVSGLANIIN
jgi:hypothetical protein